MFRYVEFGRKEIKRKKIMKKMESVYVQMDKKKISGKKCVEPMSNFFDSSMQRNQAEIA